MAGEHELEKQLEVDARVPKSRLTDRWSSVVTWVVWQIASYKPILKHPYRRMV